MMRTCFFDELRRLLEWDYGYWYDDASGTMEKQVPGAFDEELHPKDREQAREWLFQHYLHPVENLDDGRYLIQFPRKSTRGWANPQTRWYLDKTIMYNDDPRLQKLLPLLDAEIETAREKATAYCRRWELHFPDSFGVGEIRAEAEGITLYRYVPPKADTVDSPEKARERADLLEELLRRYEERLKKFEVRNAADTVTAWVAKQRLASARQELEELRRKWPL